MTELIAIAAVAVVAWFAAGTIWNVRTGRELMRWMQGGLPALGERTTVRWLGSTAVEIALKTAVDYLREHSDLQVIRFVLFDRRTYEAFAAELKKLI